MQQYSQCTADDKLLHPYENLSFSNFILDAYINLICTQKHNYFTKTKNYQGQNYQTP